MRSHGWPLVGTVALSLLATLAFVPALARAQTAAGEVATTAAAAVPTADDDTADSPNDDPCEPFNRAMFDFNEGLDRWAIKPAAVGWDTVLPRTVQVGVDNFFENLRFPARFVNNLLQGELDPAVVTLCRFVVNTTAGLGGFIDWGTDMGLPQHAADFGQTLGRWGVPPGPYIVWPVFGSSNPRDTAGIAADSYLDVSALFGDIATLAAARVVQTVNTRSLLLDEVDAAREASFDFYIAVRTAYFERRQRLIRGLSDRERDDDLYFPDYSDQEVLP